MANHAQVYRKGGNITEEEFLKAFHQINDEVFNGLLIIEKNSYGHTIMPDKSGYEGICIEIVDKLYDFEDDGSGEYAIKVEAAGSHIDIRHGHGCDFYWWLDILFTKKFMVILDAVSRDDGGGDVMTVETMKPIETSFLTYLKKKYTSFKDPNKFFQDAYDSSLERCAILEEDLSAEIYNTFVTEKTKRRLENIDKIL